MDQHPALGELLASVRQAKERAPSLDDIVTALNEARSRANAAYEQSARAAGDECTRTTRRLEDTMHRQVDQANAQAEAELKAAKREIEARRRVNVDGFSAVLREGRRAAGATRDQ